MRGTPKTFADFRGGVNRRDAPYLLGDTEARDARNVQATSRGAIRKRDGSLTFAVPPAVLTSLFAAENPNFLIGAAGDSLYSIASDATVTTIASGLTPDLPWSHVLAPANGGQGPLYGSNGAQARQWTGSGSAAAWTAASGTLPIGKYVVSHGLRVWVAGMTAYGSVADPGSTLVFSDLGNPRAWPVENVVQFDPNDGEQISGIGRVGPYLLVFKPSKSWVVYDLDTGANRPLAENVGCVAHRSIVETQHGAYFLTRDQGVMRTNGSGADRVDDRLQSLIDGMMQVNRDKATGVNYRGHYYLSISLTGSENTILLDYDEQLDSWWLHTLPAAELVVWESFGDPRLYAARPDAPRVDRLFVPGRTLDGDDVTFLAYWLGPHHTFGSPFRRKRVRELHFDGSGRMQVSLAKDFAGAPTLVGDANFSVVGDLFGGDKLFGGDGIFGEGAAEVFEQEILNPGVAKAWSVQFGVESSDPLTVDSYTFLLQDRTD